MKRERGVALLLALLVVALAAILAAALLDRGEVARAALRNQVRGEQSFELMRGLELWAGQALMADLRAEPDLDTLADAWAQPLPPIEVPGARIHGRLRDLGGCFNLNDLAPDGNTDADAVQRLRRVLRGLRLPEAIAAQAADWADRDLQAQAQGAEDAVYAAAQPPGRAGNHGFVSVDELRRLPAVDAAAFAALVPLVCAVPGPTRINLNTAPPALWLSVDDRIDLGIARRLARGADSAFRSLDAVQAALQREGIEGADLRAFGLSSEWFLLEARIDSDGVAYTYTSLLNRGRSKTRVQWRVRGQMPG